MKYPETEFHINTDNLQDFKKAYLKYMSNIFDIATSSDLEEIKEKEKMCRKLNKTDYMMKEMLNKYYDLQVFKRFNEDSYSLCNLKETSLIQYKHIKLIKITGINDIDIGSGILHFVADDMEYLLLPWCYIVSMVPSKDGD